MADSPYGANYYFSGHYPLALLPQKLIDLLVGGNGETGLVPGGPVWLRPAVQQKDIVTTTPTITNGLPVYPATDTYDWTVVDDIVSRCNAANILIMFLIFGFPQWRQTIDLNGNQVPFDGQTCKASLHTAITVTGVNTPSVILDIPTGHTLSDQQEISVDYNGTNPERVIVQGNYSAGNNQTVTILNSAGHTWKPVHTHTAGCDVWNSGGQFPNAADTKAYAKLVVARYNGTTKNFATGATQTALTIQGIQTNEDWDTPGSNTQRDAQFKWFVPVWQAVGPMIRNHAPNMLMWAPAIRRTANDGSDPTYGLAHIQAQADHLFSYTPPGSTIQGCAQWLDELDYHYYRGNVGDPDPADPLPGPTSGSNVPTHAQELLAIKNVAAGYGYTNMPVACTETGWDVYDDGSGTTGTVSQQQQADFICGPSNTGNLTGKDGTFEQHRKNGGSHVMIYVLNPNSVEQAYNTPPTATETKDIVQNVQNVAGGAKTFTKLKAYTAMQAYIASKPSWGITPPPTPVLAATPTSFGSASGNVTFNSGTNKWAATVTLTDSGGSGNTVWTPSSSLAGVTFSPNGGSLSAVNGSVVVTISNLPTASGTITFTGNLGETPVTVNWTGGTLPAAPVLAVTPTTIGNTSPAVSQSGNTWTATVTLSELSGAVNSAWTPSSSLAGVTFSPTSGSLTPGGAGTTITISGIPATAGSFTFSGANGETPVVVTWTGSPPPVLNATPQTFDSHSSNVTFTSPTYQATVQITEQAGPVLNAHWSAATTMVGVTFSPTNANITPGGAGTTVTISHLPTTAGTITISGTEGEVPITVNWGGVPVVITPDSILLPAITRRTGGFPSIARRNSIFPPTQRRG